MDAVRIRLCGTFGVIVADEELAAATLGSRRARLLLELLAADRQRTYAVDQIVEVLWPEQPPRNPVAGVATLVSRLRRALGTELIQGARGSYRLGEPPIVEVDLEVAAALVAEAERLLDSQGALSLSAVSSAIDRLARQVLEDEPYADWAEPARAERLSSLRRARHIAVRAALSVGELDRAIEYAAAAEDPLDERAHRDLMSAQVAAGDQVGALATYERLRTSLRDELGIDPAAATRELHLAILRDELVPHSIDDTAVPVALDRGLPGRDRELSTLGELWTQAVGGSPRTVVLLGEAGIGKTRLTEELAELVTSTGGVVLRARSYETERSLLLQPVVEALSAHLGHLSAAVLSAVVGEVAPVLVDLLPFVGTVLDVPAESGGGVALRRRRIFDALNTVLVRLSQRAPVLFVLDDVQNAGRSTLEWLAYLTRQVSEGRFLVVAAVRIEEAAAVHAVLSPQALEIEVGHLDRAAVETLVGTAGGPDVVDAIMARTNGHTMYVLELVQALALGSTDPTATLQETVVERVSRLGEHEERLLRGAAVLGAKFDVDMLASVLGIGTQATAVLCERALNARLLSIVGTQYEFAHDVVQEVLYATTPAPTRTAQHRRAADLLTDNPEAVGVHAAAAGDWARAAGAWLVAAETALRRLAAREAESMAGRALDAARRIDDQVVAGRALMVRARAREAFAAWSSAHEDLLDTVRIARATGDRRLEMIALRQLGGDVPVALGHPVHEYAAHIDAALSLAGSLGDREMLADLLDRSAVIATNRLRFTEAIEKGSRALQLARASGDENALCQALDGLKAAYAYLGETGPLAAVLTELEPLLRRRGDIFLLEWTVFESSFVPLAAGEYDAADRLIERAVQMCRNGGYVGYEGWFLSHRGWLARLRGDLASAVELGVRSVERSEELAHAWWHAASRSFYAGTLLQAGRRAEAVGLLEEALPIAEESGVEGYLLRCLALLAAATGSRDVLERADALLSGARFPAGTAWLLGADAYLGVANAWIDSGEPDRARAVIEPFLVAARRVPFRPLIAPAGEVLARAG